METPGYQLEAAQHALAEAWLRDNPGKTAADMPEALKMAEGRVPTNEYLEKLWSQLRGMSGITITEEDFKKAHRTAMSSAGGKATAKKRAEQKEAEAYREEMFAEQAHKGVLVALWVSAGTAAELAVDGGEAADGLHVTLCYGGDAEAMSELEMARLVSTVDQLCGWRSPLEGVVSGYGRFNASTTSDGQDVFYASVDIPGLSDLRNELVSMLSRPDCNYQISRSHDYNPHITLAYVDADAENPVDRLDGAALRFNMVTIIAGDKRVDVPFAGFRPSIYATAEKGGAWKLFVEQAFAEATVPDAINVLPKPGSYSHPSYGKITITTERNQRFVKNFDDRVYQQTLPLTLDIEHDGKSAGAIGYFERLVMREDGSVDAEINWTERGKKLMEEDAFRYFSPEWWDKWTDPSTRQKYEDVLIGGAICTRPFFKESALRPLVASEEGLAAPSSSGAGVMVLELMEVSEGDDTVTDKTVTLSEEDAKKFADLQVANETATVALAEANKTATALAEEVKQLRQSDQRRRFADIVMGRGGEGDGAVFVGPVEDNVESLVRIAEAFGENSDQFNAEVKLRQTAAAAFKESKAFTPQGSAEPGKTDDAGTNVEGAAADAAAQKLMSENDGLNYADALVRVFRENPGMYEAHRNFSEDHKRRD